LRLPENQTSGIDPAIFVHNFRMAQFEPQLVWRLFRWRKTSNSSRQAIQNSRVLGMSIMTRLRVQSDHVKSVFEIARHFKNPWLLVLLRLGLIKTPYFLHRISKDSRSYALMARPTTTSCADLFILRDVLITEAYKDVLAHLPKQVRLLDIGANLGSFTIWMQRTLGVREAFCFEPEPDSFRLLNFNLSLNDCKVARTIECAVGGESRIEKIALKNSSPGGTSLYMDYESSAEATPVPVVALAEWLGGIQGDFDLLKMDCEGSEWEIVEKTNPQHFARFRVLLAEAHTDPVRNRPVSEFKRLVENLGYRTVRWDDKILGLYIGVRP
jgi:FkbM family methyltransferase